MAALPGSASLSVYAKGLAVRGPAAFAAALPGAAVLVRIDERGGLDEPSPWALYTPVAIAADDDDDTDNRFVDSGVFAAEETATGPVTRELPLPAAKDAATAFVVPRQPRVCLGRSNDADVVVGERSISRRHALIDLHDGVYSISDAGSATGIEKNGHAVSTSPVALHSGDVVVLADVAFLFLDVEAFCRELPRLCGHTVP